MILDWDYILLQLKDVTILSTFIRLLLAAVFGGTIGMERGRHRRAAGLRTHMLVCVGATLAMLTNQYIVSEFGGADPSRLGAQVISGIGFLGVGTIIVDREQQQVRGLTTAAGLWACACMGLALGIGFYMGAFFAYGFILATIIILNRVGRHIVNKSRSLEIYTEFETHGQISGFVALLAKSSIKISHLERVRPREPVGKEDPRTAAILALKLPKRCDHDKLLEELENANGLIIIEELR